MELQLNKTYIFDTYDIYSSAPFKGEVEELTETTVFIKNLDKETKTRYNFKKFKEKWRIMESL
jgi:hypothetical protein